MDTVYRSQVSLLTSTALPEDVITNTWHFLGTSSSSSLATDAASVGTLLTDFYHEIDGNLASGLSGSIIIKTYDLGAPEPRVPLLTWTIGITPSADFGLPYEVALCLSYKSATGSGDIAARHRGRIYLGPIANTVSETNAGRVRPTTTFTNAIATAGGHLITASAGTVTPWCVFSPTVAGPKAGDGTYPNLLDGATVTTSGWVDNAWDTIRSRGTKATARVAF